LFWLEQAWPPAQVAIRTEHEKLRGYNLNVLAPFSKMKKGIKMDEEGM
jgi:hypothetical protein